MGSLRPVGFHKQLLLSRQGGPWSNVLSHIVCRWGVQLCYCAELKHEPVDLPLYLMIAYGGEWEVNGWHAAERGSCWFCVVQTVCTNFAHRHKLYMSCGGRGGGCALSLTSILRQHRMRT